MEETYSLGRTNGSQRRLLILVRKKPMRETTVKQALCKVRLRQEEQEHTAPLRN